MPSAVDSAFEVAFWFSDRALNDNEYLQPIKLQYLMFLAQSYYAVAYEGKRLVPAIFVAEEVGPIEPAIYQTFTRGRPNIEVSVELDDDVRSFVDSIWRRFGHHSAEYLAKLCRRNPAYKEALKRGRRAEISLDDMRKTFIASTETPAVESVVKPKVMRSHTGRAVEVKAWAPRTVKPK
ncbi:MAG: DUF4065 domain-containing protein [Rhodospirillales bacterium]|jgi:uncharacterized phage-associated protein|nr:DUF4065 domain-containing protein [Rhodospirillales bacterium]MDP6842570.1 DUF4065 domain-containing protein [Rhodospirillales bacterium]|tara:strand:- start:620 stop:1156 length:537 start_codon:yes stop_codon:yes gene_type:complete